MPAKSKNAGKIKKAPIPLAAGFQTRLATEFRRGKPSGPVCGGIVNGKAQKRYEIKPATFTSAATGKCPSGSFFDIDLLKCWAYPNGVGRTFAAVDNG